VSRPHQSRLMPQALSLPQGNIDTALFHGRPGQ
jgi:hypothetical protein